MQEGGERMSIQESKKEWSKGLSGEAVFLIDSLNQEQSLGTVIDCGAGEGRHSVYTAKMGAGKVIAIEKDSQQASLIEAKKEEDNLSNLEIVNGDVLEKLSDLRNSSAEGIIDCGMSHCLKEEDKREKFASLIQAKLKPGGLYSITHFSENETLSTEHFDTDLEGLKNLFPDDDWEEVMPWQEVSWKREDGQKHFAYKAVLKKKVSKN